MQSAYSKSHQQLAEDALLKSDTVNSEVYI